jgi:hypothetical protein
MLVVFSYCIDSEIGKVRPGNVVPVMYPGGVHALLYVTWLASRSYTTIYTSYNTQEDIRTTMKSLIHRSRAVRPARAIAAVTTSTIPRTRTIPHLVRTYHASVSTTTIDPSTFPVTRGYTPPKDGRPHFKKILIANRCVSYFQRDYEEGRANE